jgi:MFS family permease
MDIMKVVNKAKDITLKPKESLESLKDEKITKENLLIYLGIVSVPTLIGNIIGFGLVGLTFGLGSLVTFPLGWAVAFGVVWFIAVIISIIIFGYVFNMLASSFSSEQNLMQSMKLVAYAATPSLLAGIFNIFPLLGRFLVFIAALYGIYILYLGLPMFMKTPQDKCVVYLIVGIIIYVVIMAVISFLISGVMWSVISYSVPRMY